MKQGFTENPRFHNLTNFIIMTPSAACLHLMENSGNFNILAIHKKGYYQSEGVFKTTSLLTRTGRMEESREEVTYIHFCSVFSKKSN